MIGYIVLAVVLVAAIITVGVWFIVTTADTQYDER